MPRNAAEWDAYWADPRSAGGGPGAFSQWANSGAAQDQWTSITTGDADPLGLGGMNIALGGNLKNVRPSFKSIGPRVNRGGPPRDKGGGGLGGWLANLGGDFVEIATGIPGAVKLGGKFVGGAIGTAFTAGQNETAKRWVTDSAKILGEGVKETGAAWKDLAVAAATFGKHGDARYFFEDPGYLALDLGAVASLGSGATVRGAALVNKAARTAAAKQRGLKPNKQAEALEKHFQAPAAEFRVPAAERALRDLGPAGLRELAMEARNAPKVGKRTNRNPNRDISIDPSDLSRAPGVMNAGRIMRRDYLEGRDLIADPLSRMEQIALRTNWARLQPSNRFSPFRQGSIRHLTKEQQGWRSPQKGEADPLEVLKDGSIKLYGRKRSKGPLRRGVQSLVVDKLLGRPQQKAMKSAIERPQGAGTAALEKPSTFEKIFNPLPRLEKKTGVRIKREAVEAASTASVQAGGMPLAAAIRKMNKDPELSLAFQELSQIPPRTVRHMQESLQFSLDARKRKLQEIGDTGAKDKTAQLEETIAVLERLVDPNHPIYKMGSREQRIIVDALNNSKKYRAELKARGLNPSRLQAVPDGTRNWRDVEWEARTAVNRIARGAGRVMPLSVAGKGKHSRVVNIDEYLKREAEAVYNPVDKNEKIRTREQRARIIQRQMDSKFAYRDGDSVDKGTGRVPTAEPNGKSQLSAQLPKAYDTGNANIAEDFMLSDFFTPRTSATLMNVLSERRVGRLSDEELKRFTHTDILEAGGTNKAAAQERGLLLYFNRIVQAVENEYIRKGPDRYVLKSRPNMTPISLETAMARLSGGVSIKRVAGAPGGDKLTPVLFDTKNATGTYYERITKQGKQKLSDEFVVEGDNAFLERVRKSVPDQKTLETVEFVRRSRAAKRKDIAIWDADLKDRDSRKRVITELERYADTMLDKGLDADGKQILSNIAEKDMGMLARVAALALKDDEFVRGVVRGNGREADKLTLNEALGEFGEAFSGTRNRFEKVANDFIYSQTGWIIDAELGGQNFYRAFTPGDLEAYGRRNSYGDKMDNEPATVIDWDAQVDQIKKLSPDELKEIYSDPRLLGAADMDADAVFWNHTLRRGNAPESLRERLRATQEAVGGDIQVQIRNYELWMNGQVSFSTTPFMRMLDETVRAAGQESFLGQVYMTHSAKNQNGQIMIFRNELHMNQVLDPNQWVLVTRAKFQEIYNAVEKRHFDKSGLKSPDTSTEQWIEQWDQLRVAAEAGPSEGGGPMFQYMRTADEMNSPNSSGPLNDGAGRDWVKEGVSPNDGGFAIRREMYKQIDELSKDGSKLMATYDNFLNAWRAGLLALAPRWFLNNFLGNTFFWGVATGFDLKALKMAYGAVKTPNGPMRRTYGGIPGANTANRVGGSDKRFQAETGKSPEADEPTLYRYDDLEADAVRRQESGDIEQSRGEILGYGVEGSTYSSQGQSGGRYGKAMQEDTPFSGMARAGEGRTKMSRVYWEVTDKGFRVNQNFEALMRRAVGIHFAKQALKQNGQKTSKRFLPAKWDQELADYETMKAIANMDEGMMRDVLQETRNWIGDYGNLTRFERNVMRRAIPFYSWLRVINTWLFGLPFRSPLRAELLATAAQLGQVAYAEDQSVLPWWERGRLRFRNPLNGDQIALRTSGMNPLASVVEPIRDISTSLDQGKVDPTEMLKQGAKSLLGSSAPMIQAGAAVAGKNLFGDREFTGPMDYYGAVTPFGGQPQYFNPATGEYETRSHTPHLADIASDVLPGFNVAMPILRTVASGNRTPYDTAGTMDIVFNRLGLPGGSADKDLFQPPRQNNSGRTPFMGLAAARPGLSMLGAPIYNVDHDQEIKSYLVQQAKRMQNQRSQLRSVARQEELRRIQREGGFAYP